MREYLSTEEKNVICRAFLLFMLVVLIGITTVEKQLNSLTQLQSNIQVFNITRDQAGNYLAYIFGETLTFKAVYPLGAMQVEPNKCIVFTRNKNTVIVPAVISFDAAPLRYWVQLWGTQFKDEAVKTKEALQKYGKVAFAALSDIFYNIKLLCRKLMEYVKSYINDAGNKKYKYYYCKIHMFAV